jgi:DNA polymerase III delta prime subunit
MMIQRLICLLILSLAIISSTTAQIQTSAQAPVEGGAPLTPEQQKAREELENKALVLLDEVIGDAQVFKNPENRLIIKIAAADLLWPRNETRARILFKEAANNLNEVTSAADDSDTPEIPFMDTPAELRRSLVQALARHDPQWARDVLRSTRPAAPQLQSARARSGGADTELQLEQSLSAQIAASDPKQALEVAEQALSKGMTYELLNTLSLLMRKDREAAARLASKIVTKLQTENLSTNEGVMQTAINFLRLAAKPPEPTQSKIDAGATQPPLLSQQELRDLSELIVSGALNSSENSYVVLSLQPLLPEIEKYAPTRLPQLRRKISDARKQIGRYGGMGPELQEVMQSGTVDALLEAASKAPKEMRSYVYHTAAMKALDEGNADRAREIANENISEPSMRKYLMQEIDRRQMMRAAAEGKMDQTRQMLARLRTNEERVMVLTQLALAASAKGEKKVALALLDEARSMVSLRARNFMQLGAQLQVARAYARLDASRGLAVLEPVIDQLNELIAAGALLGGFYSEQFVRDEEIQLGPMNDFIMMFANQYAADLNALASEDFERTKAVADRFQRGEVRTLARLLIVRSILSPRPPANVIPGGVGILSGEPTVVLDEGP